MKLKLFSILGVFALLITARALELSWDPIDPTMRTYVQVMDLPSSNLTTYPAAVGSNGVVIPGSVKFRAFRAMNSNSFGMSEWTEWYRVPPAVTGLKVTVALTP